MRRAATFFQDGKNEAKRERGTGDEGDARQLDREYQGREGLEVRDWELAGFRRKYKCGKLVTLRLDVP